jgi:exodeoxyribonuclease VII large subunit
VPVLFSLVKTRQDARLDSLSAKIQTAVRVRLDACGHRLERLSSALRPLAARRVTAENHRLELLAQRVAAADPANLLRRGYSITLHDGRAVRSADDLKQGDVIETRFGKGSVKSEVVS